MKWAPKPAPIPHPSEYSHKFAQLYEFMIKQMGYEDFKANLWPAIGISGGGKWAEYTFAGEIS